jgi:CHAT domain-containing protein
MIKNEQELSYLRRNVINSLKNNRSLRNAYAALDLVRWTNLPGTLTEVKNIEQLIDGADIHTGDEVNENNVKNLSAEGKLGKYKIIHFATHGLIVPSIPQLSAIVLSQFSEERNGEDGFLNMEEIADLNFKADFINLSACETGLGKIYSGEGVVGLTHSFFVAGANGLSVSLWQVADDSTALFMSALYEIVQKKGVSYADAMAITKRKFVNGDFGKIYRSPYYWAPFVYYGR